MTTAVRSLGSFFFAVLFFSLLVATAYADHAININAADKETLMTLTGIGETKAQAIIDYRTANGPFATKEDIQDVTGIGPSTFAGIESHIVVSGGVSQQQAVEEAPAQTNGTTTQETQPQTGGGSYAIEPQLLADAGEDRGVIVGADTSFSGKAFKKDGTPIGPQGVRFLWNFGDGKTQEGANVMHRFAHPGRYTVTLQVSADVHSASDRIVVTARAAEFDLSSLPDGSAVIENESAHELDLSFWFVRQADKHFAIPESTVILVGERIIIPPDSLGFAVQTGWQLLYPNGAIAETALPPKPVIVHEKTQAAPLIKDLTPPRTSATMPAAAEPAPEIEPATSTAQVASVAASQPSGLMGPWLYGLIALISIGAVGAFFASRYTQEKTS